MPGSRSFKIRALCSILIPIILAGIVITYVAVSSTRHMLVERADQFGGAIADQLATSVSDQLVQRDLLGLNVTLGNLVTRGDFSFASVYSADNKLVAQAGKNTGNLTLFTRDVVFQNAAAGYVQVGFSPDLVDSPISTILL
ncbi:MAG TPA: hypothetical protein VJ998_11075, partial [Pseudomonadales bacterium]|nr:hypothetical protein [Pseudomonadales bacterium]